MNEDEPVHDEHPGTDELARRLEAYAVARLSPDRPTVLRMRARVREAADLRAAVLRSMDEGSTRPLPLRGRRPGLARRAASLLAAAALGLALATGATAAAMPGGPLYGARLWLEGATLPSTDDARAGARIAQLTDRLAEAQHAAVSGDQDAVAAALAAYREEVEAALGEAGGDDARLARLEAALGTHIAVLEALQGTVPEQARDAIGHALDASHKAIDRIGQDEPDPASTDDPGASHGPDRSGKPGRTDPPGHASPTGASSAP